MEVISHITHITENLIILYAKCLIIYMVQIASQSLNLTLNDIMNGILGAIKLKIVRINSTKFMVFSAQ